MLVYKYCFLGAKISVFFHAANKSMTFFVVHLCFYQIFPAILPKVMQHILLILTKKQITPPIQINTCVLMLTP